MRHVLTAFKKYSNYEKQPIVFSLHECRFFGGRSDRGVSADECLHAFFVAAVELCALWCFESDPNVRVEPLDYKGVDHV